MADTTAPKKTRKAGTRTAKPLFAVVSYTDSDGSPVTLNKAGLSIRLERDAAKLLDMIESGSGGAAVLRVELPAAASKANPAPTA